MENSDKIRNKRTLEEIIKTKSKRCIKIANNEIIKVNKQILKSNKKNVLLRFNSYTNVLLTFCWTI